jgi:hypothetical protein
MPTNAKKSKPWWGTFQVPLDTCARWEIGPLSLWMERRREYWTVVRDRDADPFLNRSNVIMPVEPPREPAPGKTQRFGASGESGSLKIRPMHADRPVVITPEQPFTLPPKRTVHLYVSLPLWYQVIDGEEGGPLIDEAVVRPSDTWHGPNTLVGQICYASRTRANVELVGRLPHRVVAPLEVRNGSETDLRVERIKLPTPHLSILADERGELWAEAVVFEKAEGQAQAGIRIEPDPRPQGQQLEVLSAPRLRAEKKFVWHAFGEIFGTGW